MPKFKALYPTDNVNFLAILEDGALVRLLNTGVNAYDVFEVKVTDKRPEDSKGAKLTDVKW